MSLSRLTLALTSVLAAACLFVSPPAARAASCGAAGYAYAGLASAKGVFGITAGISSLGRPLVESGHVAAWVGLGGPGEGPGGATEWIQTGLNSIPGSGNKLYIEVAHPNGKIDYSETDVDVPNGLEHRLAVLEVSGQPNVWQVWVDGQPVGKGVYLPGSHRSLTPMAVAENWDGGRPSCNRFAYSFTGVQVAAAAGGSWRGLTSPTTMQDSGYKLLRRTADSFVAQTTAAIASVQPRTPAATPAASTAAARPPKASPPARPTPAMSGGTALGTN